MFRKRIAMDLGTANTLIMVQSQGIVLNEPSVVAVEKTDGRILAVGRAAKGYIGRTPQNISTIRPLRDGVIADFDMASELIAHFLREVIGGKSLVMKPDVVICVPVQITDVERRSVVEAALQAGAREVRLLEEPLAAALGAGLPVKEPVGSMVVDIGGGTTDVAVVTLCSMASARSIRVAGDTLNQAVQRYVQEKFQLLVGENMAEKIKITIGTVEPLSEELSMEVSGKDALTGGPKTIRITDGHIREALQDVTAPLLQAVRQVLENTPPELGGDIIRHGILLTGGGSLLKGLDMRIARETGLAVRLDDNPLTTVLRGAGVTLDAPEEYKDMFIL